MKDKAKRKDEIELDGIDLVVLAIIGVLAIVVVIQVVPLIWGWCVVVFNVRKWSRWVWMSIGVAVLVLLVWLHARQNQ